MKSRAAKLIYLICKDQLVLVHITCDKIVNVSSSGSISASAMVSSNKNDSFRKFDFLGLYSSIVFKRLL